MELPNECGVCGKPLVDMVQCGIIATMPCETCLENARQEVRLEKSKEMVAFCEKLQSKEVTSE